MAKRKEVDVVVAAAALLGLDSGTTMIKRGRIDPGPGEALCYHPAGPAPIPEAGGGAPEILPPVPEFIVTKLLCEYVASDAQLAVYSNVCRMWRRKAAEVVAEEATRTALRVVRDGGREGGGPGRGVEGCGEEDESRVRGLLLVDMSKAMLIHFSGGSVTPAQPSEGHFCLAWFSPAGIRTTDVRVEREYDEEDVGRFSYREVGQEERVVECCREWRGLRKPIDVLSPFGYEESFLAKVFEATIDEAVTQKLLPISATTAKHDILELIADERPSGSAGHRPTLAVRGATLARPEGHCLCLEEGYSPLSNGQPPAKPTLSGHIMRLSVDQMKDRFGNCKVDLLPRVVHGSDGIHQKQGVHFLIADKSHAARLITPFFDCGGVSGPITMFMVVKSSGHGCWVSGRNSHFEIGNLFTLHGHAPSLALLGNRGGDDMSLDETESEPPLQCMCSFKSGDPFRCKHPSEWLPREDRVCRGGSAIVDARVHCYCAIFDGELSMIRVDGSLSGHKREGASDLGANVVGYDPEQIGRLVGSGVLDGLSLGANHQFDYTLACDTVASHTILHELAVFKGRLNDEDIEKMELHLMSEYDINP